MRPSLLLYQVQPGPLLGIVFLSLLHFSFYFLSLCSVGPSLLLFLVNSILSLILSLYLFFLIFPITVLWRILFAIPTWLISILKLCLILSCYLFSFIPFLCFLLLCYEGHCFIFSYDKSHPGSLLNIVCLSLLIYSLTVLLYLGTCPLSFILSSCLFSLFLYYFSSHCAL